MTDERLLLTVEDKVAAEHTAVVAVDLQNDFCAADGYYGRTGADLAAIQRALPRIRGLVDAARRASVPVVLTRTIYDEHLLSGAQKERHVRRYGSVVAACRSGTWGAELCGIEPTSEDTVITKHRYSAFHGTPLDLLLRSRGIRTVVVVGVATNVCVESTARDAFMHDYYVVVVEDCAAARTEALHMHALENVERHFGIVVDSARLARIWDRRESEGGHGSRAQG